MSENIQDAEIISETKAGDTPAQTDDLIERLKQATEYKQPGQTAPKQTNNFWAASDDDFERPKPNAQTPTPAQTQTEQTNTGNTPAQTQTENKISEKVYQQSARSAVHLVDFFNKITLGPALTFKLTKKIERTFTEEQQQLIETKLMDADPSKLDEKEKTLRNRFEGIVKKFEKKEEKIPMFDKEKRELQEAFEEYFKITNTQLSPKWFIAAELLEKVVGKWFDTLKD